MSNEQLPLFDPAGEGKRQAPRNGYTSTAKSDYRDQVWRCLRAAAASQAEGDILILPSSEGLEIDVAVASGIHPANIIAVDQDASILRGGDWHTRYPQVRPLACEIGQFANHHTTPITAANLDLCSQIGVQTDTQITRFMETASFTEVVHVAFTVVACREVNNLTAYIGATQHLPGVDPPPALGCLRIYGLWVMALAKLPYRCAIVGQGSYRQNRQGMTMSWAAFRFERVHKLPPRYRGSKLPLVMAIASVLEAEGEAMSAAEVYRELCRRGCGAYATDARQIYNILTRYTQRFIPVHRGGGVEWLSSMEFD